MILRYVSALLLGLGLCAPMSAVQAGSLLEWIAAYVSQIPGHLPETTVITPGLKVFISGKPAEIFGYQSCPISKGDRAFFLGGVPLEQCGCAVIDKDTKFIMVDIIVDGHLKTEGWTVERNSKSEIFLKRPNNEYVGAIY